MSEIRRVTVTECKPKFRKDGTPIAGTNASGPWTMHTVFATDDTGLPIQEDMISFSSLPLGEPVELEFVRKDDPQYGVSYTVSFPKGAKRPYVPPANDEYEMLREMVQRAIDRISALETHTGIALVPGRTDVPAVVQQPVTVGAVSAPSTDDDIPF